MYQATLTEKHSHWICYPLYMSESACIEAGCFVIPMSGNFASRLLVQNASICMICLFCISLQPLVLIGLIAEAQSCASQVLELSYQIFCDKILFNKSLKPNTDIYKCIYYLCHCITANGPT